MVIERIMRGVAAASLCIWLGSACGGSTAPGVDASVTGAAAMAATIAGSSWHATVVSLVRSQAGKSFGISGTDNSTYNVGFTVNATSTGTFTLSFTCPTPVHGAVVRVPSASEANCLSNGVSGSVTITNYSADGASGTFNFVMVLTSPGGGSNTLSVQSGTFSAKF